MFISPSFKKSLIVEQFQGNYLKQNPCRSDMCTPSNMAASDMCIPHPPPLQKINNYGWERVRNLKCIFLKSLLLYQLTSRQQFYFEEYWREIPETRGNQRTIVSRCSDLKDSCSSAIST